jgi:hypothetical protein
MKAKVMLAAVAALAWAGPVLAQPLVREAVGTGPAAIQAAVDAFRTDLGGVNNGNVAGSQAGGRREINWDGGGAAAVPTLDPSPMTRFSNRGAVFTTPGLGFEISGAPTPNFGEINPAYGTHFAPFSSPRLFSALGSNVLDVWFFVPGSTTIAAGVTGFGAVFTGVSRQGTARLEFYAVDGALLYEHAVASAAGDGSLSFVGVSFPYGEIVGRVRIISGNTALGPADTAAIDAAVMDDFIYGEPVAAQGLSIAPQTSRVFRTASLDLIVGVSGLTGATVTRIAVGRPDVPLCGAPRSLDRWRPCPQRRAHPQQPDQAAQCSPLDGGGQHRAIARPVFVVTSGDGDSPRLRL